MTATAPATLPDRHEGSALVVRGLSTVYGTSYGRITAVRDVSFQIEAGEAVGIVGETGSGKTAVALALVGLLPRNGRIVAGEISLGGVELVNANKKLLQGIRGRRIAMVFQDSMTSLDPLMPIGKQICEGMVAHLGTRAADARQRARGLLEEVGVPDPATRLAQYPHQLSGGLRQRVAIAVAIAANPDVLVADEPTTALDVTIQAQVLDLLARERQRRGMALILITHDLGVVASVTDRVMVMYAGRVVESGNTEDIFRDPRHPYTLGLMKSMPRLDSPLGVRPASIPGFPPTGYGEVAGCPFSPRCMWARSACRAEYPPLERVAGAAPTHEAACLVDVRTETPGDDR
jgi:oligopeptide/dipeptide ABC transporter ATP-binding protein